MVSHLGRSLLVSLGLLLVFVAPAAATPTGTFSYVPGSSVSRQFLDGDTVYFNASDGPGSFTVAIDAAEASGIAGVNFATAGAGWSGGGPDSTSPYSMVYAWSDHAPSASNVTATITANNGTLANIRYNFVADAVAPNGSFLLAEDARSGACFCGAELTLDPGTDAGAGIRGWYVKRSVAPIDAEGECGAYSTPTYPIAQPTSGMIDTTAVSGNCYRYALQVIDEVNNIVETADHVLILPEPVPPAVSLDDFEPLSSSMAAWMHADDTTLYVNSNHAGSVVLHASAAHPNGIKDVTFDAPGAVGWTLGSGLVDSTDPYAAIWAWGVGAGSPGTHELEAEAFSGETATNTFAVITDAEAPVGGSISYADSTSGSNASVSFVVGSDAGSGIAAHQVLRREAAVSNGACGTFGAWASTGASGGASPYASGSLGAGSCYQFALRVSDRVGNEALFTNDSVVRVPAASTVVPSDTTPKVDPQPVVPKPAEPVRTSEGFVTGSGGSEKITRGAGADTIVAAGGNDRVIAGAGNDELDGGSGNDALRAGSGNDLVGGGAGKDTIDGGTGNDQITAGPGNDTAMGGAGSDHIVGESGKDRLTGGPGNDVLLAADKQGGDVVQCGAGTDTVSADKGDFVARDCERFTATSPVQQSTGSTTPPKGNGKPTKVSICHATGSASNPYTWITVPVDGMSGHAAHRDDLVPAPELGCPKSTRLPPVAEPAGSIPPPAPTVKPLPPLPPSTCPADAPVTMTTPRTSRIELIVCGRTEFVAVYTDPYVGAFLAGVGNDVFGVGSGPASFRLKSGATVSWTTEEDLFTVRQVTITKGAHTTTLYSTGPALWGYAPDAIAVQTALTRRDLYDLRDQARRCIGLVWMPLRCS